MSRERDSAAVASGVVASPHQMRQREITPSLSIFEEERVSAVMLEELSPDAVKEYLANDDIVLIVSGSTENNGPHLPVGTDTYAATHLAKEVSRETGILVAPIIPWGISSVNAGFAGTVSLLPETLSRVFENICTSLAYHGFRRFLVIAGHYENAWPLAGSAEILRDRGLLVVQLDLWRAVEKHSRDLAKTGAFAFGHGGEVMTSVMLASNEPLVSRDNMVTELPDETFGLKYYRSYPEVMGFAAWDDVTKCGSVGDASQATRDAGNEVFARLVAVTSEIIEDMKAAQLPSVRDMF
jgi:creatinine amidohydrolase